MAAASKNFAFLLASLHATPAGSAEMLDVLKPLLFRIEKGVAARQIPPAHTVPNRLRLADLPAAGTGPRFDHSAWDRCLKAHVRPGATIGPITGVHAVDYAALSADPDFDAYLRQLAAADVRALGARERLALWMNAYNALCCAHIVRHLRGARAPPLGSILELKGAQGEPVWDRPAGAVGGRDYSLNEIEHAQLRQQWAEPAVHACIVCASASCPNLRREAFDAERLEAQMADQLADWLANPTKGFKVEGPRRVCMSRIFLWFEDDWRVAGGVRPFLLARPLPAGGAAALGSGRTAVRYFAYDWSINRAP